MVVNIALQTLSSALRQAVQCLGSRARTDPHLYRDRTGGDFGRLWL